MTANVLLSFDLDGVIMQNPFESGIEPRILAHLRESPALCDLHPEEADRRARAAIRDTWGRRAAAGEWVALFNWDSIYDEVSTGFGGTPTPDVASLVEEFCGIEGMVYLLPGARTGLERLHGEGFRLVAVTNGYYAYQWPVLQALGVAHLFERVVTPEVAGYAKPDPRLFDSVPGLRAHVGDSLVWDVLGANQAGILSIWLDDSLPDELRAAPIGERTQVDGFGEHLEAVLQRTTWRRYHPEATTPNCTPDLVVADVDEAAEAMVEHFGSRVRTESP